MNVLAVFKLIYYLIDIYKNHKGRRIEMQNQSCSIEELEIRLVEEIETRDEFGGCLIHWS